MIIMFYAWITCMIGSMAALTYIIPDGQEVDFKILGCILFLSFLGHLISLWRELDREEAINRQKIKDMHNE